MNMNTKFIKEICQQIYSERKVPFPIQSYFSIFSINKNI